MSEGKLSGISVLHVITRLDRGGSAEVVLDLARMLAKDGYRVTVITGRTDEPQADLTAYSEQTGIQLITVPELVREISPLNDIVAWLKIRKIIKRIAPDVVHTHTSKAGIIGRAAAWSLGVRAIIHTPHGHIFYGYYSAIKTSMFVLMERLAAKISDKITILTEKGKHDHIQEKIGPESLFTVISSGVDISRFRAADSRKVRLETGWPDETIIGFVGRLVHIKDCVTFIDAAVLILAQNPGVKFIVAGDGEERGMLERKAADLGLHESLVFLGNRTDIPDVMAAIDIFVLSSLNEGFGRVLVEAMAAGTAIVSTNVGGTVDVVEDGVSGILVPPSNPSAIAGAVCGLLADTDKIDKLQKRGKDRARLFDIISTVSMFEDLYEDCVGR